MARFDDLNEEPIYNTRAVVQRTGVPADTFRAWERRHGLPSPVRTSGNQRLYSEQDIALVNWLRDRTASGMTITQAIALFRSQNGTPHVNGSDPGATAAQLPGGDAGSSLPGIVHRLVDALINLDGTTADRIVEDALVMTTVESVCLDVLQATLVQIGHLWERDQAGIASEHYASAFVQRKFASLFNQSNPHEGRGPVVSACPEGEQHEIGLLLTSLFLSRRGYKIVYLGSNLPLHDLVGTVRMIQPPLILLSASRAETAHRLRDIIPVLQASLNPDLRRKGYPAVGFGGHVFSVQPELRDGIDGLFLGSDAREAMTYIDRLMAGVAS